MMRWNLLVVLLLMVCVFTLTGFVLRDTTLQRRERSKSALAVLFGDGRRLFANHFLAKADAYFHRGRYPSVFQTAERERGNALVESLGETPEAAGHAHDEEENRAGEKSHEHDESCAHAELPQGPDNWIARLAAQFEPSEHVHLAEGNQKEMLPWVKLAVEMDPHNVEAYTVGGYWLREMGKAKEAEVFLREGQRNNPDSSEIYFELGRLYEYDLHNPRMAARLYELSLDKWNKVNATAAEPDILAQAQILGGLGRVEESRGELESALRYYTLLKSVSQNPQGVQRLIDSVQAKIAAQNRDLQPR